MGLNMLLELTEKWKLTTQNNDGRKQIKFQNRIDTPGLPQYKDGAGQQ